MRKKIFLITFISLFTLFFGCTDIRKKVEKNLQENQFDKAVKEILSCKDNDDYINLVLSSVEEINNKFIHKEIDGTLAIANLNKLKKVNGAEEKIDNTIESIRVLMNSRKAFEIGTRLEKEKNYGEALDSYYYVNEQDEENYMLAKNKIEEITNYLSNNSLVEVSKSIILPSKSNDKNLIPDQMQVIIKNKSDKIITGFEITIIGFDQDNNRIRIQGKNSNVNEYIFLGVAQDIRINSNSTWGEKNAWQLDSNCKINRINGCIKKVDFLDGDSWENPLYNSWVNQNKIK